MTNLRKIVANALLSFIMGGQAVSGHQYISNIPPVIISTPNTSSTPHQSLNASDPSQKLGPTELFQMEALNIGLTFSQTIPCKSMLVSSEPLEKMFHLEDDGLDCSVFDDKWERLYLIFSYLQVIGTFKDIRTLAAPALPPPPARSHSEYSEGIILGMSRDLSYLIYFVYWYCLFTCREMGFLAWEKPGCMREWLSINIHLKARGSVWRLKAVNMCRMQLCSICYIYVGWGRNIFWFHVSRNLRQICNFTINSSGSSAWGRGKYFNNLFSQLAEIVRQQQGKRNMNSEINRQNSLKCMKRTSCFLIKIGPKFKATMTSRCLVRLGLREEQTMNIKEGKPWTLRKTTTLLFYLKYSKLP